MRRRKLTCAETRAAAKSTVGPQVPMHDAGSDQLQEQIQRVLEFIVHTSSTDRGVHRSGQRGVNVRIYEEPREIQ